MTEYKVPETDKIPRTQNDPSWVQIKFGPTIQITECHSCMDDLVTAFAQNWMASIQAHTNMLSIFNAIVQKYQIPGNATPEDTDHMPQIIKDVYSTSQYILNTYDDLLACKSTIMLFNKIRNDWGSIDAYNNAPEEQRKQWEDTAFTQLLLTTRTP